MSKNSITTKRFVIRKSLIGANQVITFTNKKVFLTLIITTTSILNSKKDLKVWSASRSMVTIQIAMQYLLSLVTCLKSSNIKL